MMEATPLKNPSVLAFERKLDPSDALLAAGTWGQRAQANGWKPMSIRTKSVRGTASHRRKTKGKDPAKLDLAVENPNPQTVDVASLPMDCDTLRVHFTLRVLGRVGEPSACNDPRYRAKLKATVGAYVSQHGFGELARRYATNIANGRFLWRNRLVAESIEVKVSRLRGGEATGSWQFDALAQPWRDFDGGAAAGAGDLAKIIEAGLAGQTCELLDVEAFVRMGPGQEVFPSQELILDAGNTGKSKTLYSVHDQAAIHSQKIGNALRTVDTWYPAFDTEEGVGPIAIEPYGSVTSLGRAFRQPRERRDFYTLLDRWVLKDQAPENVGDQHYVIANLIRGGVFGEGEDK
jgi:CRISPR-associated protein Csy3